MSEENKTVTVEEFNALKAELETTKEEHGKLSKIFEERQTKALKKEDVLKKDELLKVLGIEKNPEKEPLDLVNEKIANLTKTIEQLTNDVKLKDEKLSLTQKRSQAEKLAQALSFNDVDDAIKFVDINSENLESDLKALAESKPYLIKQVKDVGSAFNQGSKTEKALLDAFEQGFDTGKFK